MPFAAITYDIKAGYEKEIGEIFGGFRRVGSPVVEGADGAETTRILATAVFIRDATMVRVIEYEGDLQDVARFMASQPGVQEVERKLAPYLSRPRDTGTPEGFIATFNRSLLTCLTQISARES
ncbi:SchA/CurD [Streptomyces sp. SID13666]|uniref:SchA/CurD-like domain-containing protein n=1 Tax=Streptomyces TaxID=1883 RepID=UPI0011073386|nr:MULTISPECIES: SchA/CurD-like domain-containing protein [Streptomyces]MCZ4097875.1 SchA/CurD [Streptomyces sp. H39-C1]NEA57542.1 SchA/CurD [Streptomyces sp. SID13666]NEA70954.1 SchA/CurD [Streptomyces sp. SID13588]QNA76719.1 SchA/CurD [Streptomyces sp. So13.3]